MPALPTKKDGSVKKVSQTRAPGALPFTASCPSWGSDPKAYLVMSSLPPESEQLFVLPRHKVDSSVLQQGWEHEEQAHRHPNVNGFHIGHLEVGGENTGRGGKGRGERNTECGGVFSVPQWLPPPPSGCPLLSCGIKVESTRENRREMHHDWTENWRKWNMIPGRVLKSRGWCI